ncbi:hypothetical protein [Ekhidna sp.]|jgi:class I fructose-bisphosphate aldolase|uniref:hypothetical protein n=1 Tax=Ekhidna sp. TaxID=2608089 RepID=UPI0032EB0453
MRKLNDYLGDQAEYLLTHQCKAIDKARLTIPAPDYLNQVFLNTNRNTQVLNSLSRLCDIGLSLTGMGFILERKALNC